MNKIDPQKIVYEEYPLKTYDKIRYCDTDRQGHVNNALFSSFLETGRVELLYNPDKPLASEGGSFVIANLSLNLLSEIRWPGTIEIGTGITKVGNSSIRILQGLYQEGKLTATAETVIVQMDEKSRRSKPLDESTVEYLKGLLLDK